MLSLSGLDVNGNLVVLPLKPLDCSDPDITDAERPACERCVAARTRSRCTATPAIQYTATGKDNVAGAGAVRQGICLLHVS